MDNRLIVNLPPIIFPPPRLKGAENRLTWSRGKTCLFPTSGYIRTLFLVLPTCVATLKHVVSCRPGGWAFKCRLGTFCSCFRDFSLRYKCFCSFFGISAMQKKTYFEIKRIYGLLTGHHSGHLLDRKLHFF